MLDKAWSCLGNHHCFGFSVSQPSGGACWPCKLETVEYEKPDPSAKWLLCLIRSMQVCGSSSGSRLLHGKTSLAGRSTMLAHPEWVCSCSQTASAPVSTPGYLNASGWERWCWGWFWPLVCWVNSCALWAMRLFQVQPWVNTYTNHFASGPGWHLATTTPAFLLYRTG